MALENLGATLERAETTSRGSEIAKLPERAETPSEISRLPERAETPKEISKLPERTETPKETGRLPEQAETPEEARDTGAIPETDRDATREQVDKALGSGDVVRHLFERHPEQTAWRLELKAIERARDVLNDPDATDSEKFSAQKSLQANLSTLKGQLLETAVKDALSGAGLTVEAKQRVVEGEDGGTRPDVISKNDTDRPVQMFGNTVKPGEALSVECKCGNADYLKNELRNHIPNQLSGQVGHRVLLTTADVRQVDPTLVRDTCKQYGASLVVLDAKVSTVEKAIKEVLAP